LSQLRYSNVGLWEEPTITQDDVLEGVKSPIAIKGKDPFILEKRTPIFISSNTEKHQHVSSQADALVSRYFRYEFETEILCYPFCNQKHGNCITDTEQIQTLEEAETIHLSEPDSESKTIDVDLQ
jgi:hypothetical protein